MADVIVPEKMKICPRCKGEKPLATAFYVSPKGRRSSWCRDCCAIYRADYYEQNRMRIRERRGPYNREYQKRRKQENPELRQKSIAAVRAFWNSLSQEQRSALNRRKKMAKRYGLTLEQWEQIHAAQNGACAICDQVPKLEKNFHIDHDHETGAVRGLLCVRCNTALGWFEQVSGKIDRIVEYLKRGKQP